MIAGGSLASLICEGTDTAVAMSLYSTSSSILYSCGWRSLLVGGTLREDTHIVIGRSDTCCRSSGRPGDNEICFPEGPR